MDPDRSRGSQTGPTKLEISEEITEPPSSPSGTIRTNGHTPSFLSRLFGRSNGAEISSNGEVTNPDALGPAFRSGTPAELAMVNNILRLRDLRVEDVMTPRADVEAIADDTSLEDSISAFEECGFSRLPVYHETLDDPLGFVHMKDLALAYGFGRQQGTNDFKVRDHIRTALFVPPSMRIAALLQKMQGERVHMALVIDEFGGVDGLITIEDLVEQVVGDIEDEHDSDEASDDWHAEGEGGYVVNARADIREFEAASSLTLVPEGWDEEVSTLGGLVFMIANRVPTRGEVILHPEGYEFEIVDADARRIKRMRVSRGNGGTPLRQAAE
ncbi:MAG: hemolysin family protein [Pseudomonadota bacterium]